MDGKDQGTPGIDVYSHEKNLRSSQGKELAIVNLQAYCKLVSLRKNAMSGHSFFFFFDSSSWAGYLSSKLFVFNTINATMLPPRI